MSHRHLWTSPSHHSRTVAVPDPGAGRHRRDSSGIDGARTRIGLAAGLLRTYGPHSVDLAIGFYVDSMRAIPVLWSWSGPISRFRFWRAPRSTPSLPPPSPSFPPRRLRVGTIRAGLTRSGPARCAPTGAGYVDRPADPHHHPAPALIRMLPNLGSLLVDRDQGQCDRLGRGRARADAPVADPGRADLSAIRDLYRGHAVSFLSSYPVAAASIGVSPRLATLGSRDLRMVVVTDDLPLLLQGAGVTMILTVTVALAVLVGSTGRPATVALGACGSPPPPSSIFRATPLILQLFGVLRPCGILRRPAVDLGTAIISSPP